MNRISRNRTSRSSHPCIHPEPLEPRQLLAAAPVFYTTGAVTLGSPGQVVFTGTQDLAPGTTYSYDLNNDGTFEVQDSTSPACDVPAADLASVGPHTISARINNPLGTHNDYQIQIPVNPAPDYYPTLPGLTLTYAGTDGGHRATWQCVWGMKTYRGSSAMVRHEDEVSANANDSGSSNEYYAISDGLLLQLGADGDYPSTGGTSEMDFPTGMPSNRFDRSAKWSQTWTGIPIEFTQAEWGSGSLSVSGTLTVTLAVVGFQSVNLGNGLVFSRALVTKGEGWGTLRTSDGRMLRFHQVETQYYVQGVGEVKDLSTGDGTVRRQIASLPDWAKYLSLSSDGILHVNGTTSDDTITFAVKGKTLTCYRNGVPDSLPLASVRGIIITGQGGNDSIDASKLSLPVTITTGSGNDSILGSKAADSIFSGDGNDTILGGKGDDTLTGGSDNDLLYGGSGNDILTGGAGSDLLVGNAGTNTYYAQDSFPDTLDARSGHNTALWDAAIDTILGTVIPG